MRFEIGQKVRLEVEIVKETATNPSITTVKIGEFNQIVPRSSLTDCDRYGKAILEAVFEGEEMTLDGRVANCFTFAEGWECYAFNEDTVVA